MVDVGGAGQGTLCLPRHRNALSKIKAGSIDPICMNMNLSVSNGVKLYVERTMKTIK